MWSKVTLTKQKVGRDRKRPYVVRWYGHIDDDGKRRRYGKSFKTKAEAERFRTEKQHELDRGGRRDPVSGTPLKRLLDDFLKAKGPNIRPGTMELYRLTARRLLAFFGATKDVATITRRDADLFIGQQLHHLDNEQKELSTWARSQMLTHCRTIFKQAVRWEMATGNPFAECERPKTRTRKWHHIKPAEYLRLLEAAPDLRWRCLYAVLYTTGVRVGEAFSLTWADIDFERCELRIQNRAGTPTAPPFTLKAHERRTIPLTRHTLALLAEYQAEAPEGVPYVFLTADRYRRVLDHWDKLGYVDRKWQNEYMVNNVNRDFKSHCKRAGIVFDGKCSIHTIRKSCGQNWALSGVPIKTLQYLMGHSNERTTLRFYQQVDPASAAQAVSATDQMLDAAAAKMDTATDPKPPTFGRGMDAEAFSGVKSEGESVRL